MRQPCPLQASQTPSDDTARRQQLANDIIRELSVHAIVEEMHLYPLTAEAVANGEDQAERSLEEHRKSRRTLAELDDRAASDPGYDQKLAAIISVAHHVEEEGELFPVLRRSVGASCLQEAGETIRDTRRDFSSDD